MPQFLINPADIRDKQFHLTGQEAHHLIHVLRKRADDVIDLFDGQGHRFKAKLTHCDSDTPSVTGIILESHASSEETTRLVLLQSLPRAAKFDYVIEKATELGVHEIIPFMSSRSLVQLTDDQAESKRERWSRIAESAAKQCNRPDIPHIAPPQKMAALEALFKESLTIVFWEEERKHSFKEVLRKLPEKPAKINLVVGPEGGFSEDEIQWMKGMGGIVVTLGKRILRSETVAGTILSIINYELDLF